MITGRGLWVVATLYAEFWSSWTLFSHYITLIDQDDVRHRFLYVLHIFTVFITGIYIVNDESSAFDVEASGVGFSLASGATRIVLIIHWASHLRDGHHFPEGVIRQIWSHTAVFCISGSLFILAAVFLIVDDGSSGDAVVWFWASAVVIEQLLSYYLLLFGTIPFNAAYYGERCCIWVMLSLGESVISLLAYPFPYTHEYIATSCASFAFITALCVHYFDIVDCDQYLKHFVHCGQKFKSGIFIMCHGPWSFCILIIGIGVKGVMYVMENTDKESWGDDIYRRRSLGGWTIEDYEFHLTRYFDMIEFGIFTHLLLGNVWHAVSRHEVTLGDDDGPPQWRLWMGRIVSTLMSISLIAVHANMKCLECDPFYEYGYDDDKKSSYDDAGDDHGSDETDLSKQPGLEIHEAMMCIAGIAVAVVLVNSTIRQWAPMSEKQLHHYHGHHFGKNERSPSLSIRQLSSQHSIEPTPSPSNSDNKAADNNKASLSEMSNSKAPSSGNGAMEYRLYSHEEKYAPNQSESRTTSSSDKKFQENSAPTSR